MECADYGPSIPPDRTPEVRELQAKCAELEKGLIVALARIEQMKTLQSIMAMRLGLDWDVLVERSKRRMEARDRVDGDVCPSVENGLRCVQWVGHPGDCIYTGQFDG